MTSFDSEVADQLRELSDRAVRLGKGVVTRVDPSGEFETVTVAGRTMNHTIASVAAGDTVVYLADLSSAVALGKLVAGA